LENLLARQTLDSVRAGGVRNRDARASTDYHIIIRSRQIPRAPIRGCIPIAAAAYPGDSRGSRSLGKRQNNQEDSHPPFEKLPFHRNFSFSD
jgi:hypothetical protein